MSILKRLFPDFNKVSSGIRFTRFKFLKSLWPQKPILWRIGAVQPRLCIRLVHFQVAISFDFGPRKEIPNSEYGRWGTPYQKCLMKTRQREAAKKVPIFSGH